MILIERNYDEILASQAKMIDRRSESVHDSPERRDRLRRECARILDQTKTVLAARGIPVLNLRYEEILLDPSSAADQINLFTGGELEVERLSAAVDPLLHRNRDKGANL